VVNCPSGAKKNRNDSAAVRELLRIKEKVIVSLAPSFVSEFVPQPSIALSTDAAQPAIAPSALVSALKQLGFYAVSETALGADVLSREIAGALQRADQGRNLFLSSACPAVVLYIKQYAPSFIPFLNDRASPLLTHARLLRALYGEDIGVVFVGPCIAKKREADEFAEIDGALTFAELKEWLREERLTLSEAAGDDADAGFVPRRAAKGAYFPVDGGMGTAIQQYLDDPASLSTVTVSGIYRVMETLRDLSLQNLSRPLFLELLACHGGCVNGPCITRDTAPVVRGMRLLNYAGTADNRLDSSLLAHNIPLTGVIHADTAATAAHSGWDIRKTLASIGKVHSDDEINCTMCGYDTCRDFAAAIIDGRAEKTMCISYMRDLAQKKANALMRAIPSGVVIVDKNLGIIECNQNFARLLGPETEELYELVPGLSGASLPKIVSFSSYFSDVLENNAPVDMDVWEDDKFFHLSVFVIEEGEIAAGVIGDMTAPEQQRGRTVSRAQKIIEKNIETVQKIAFLLGENAAETESILNAIIDLNTTGKTEP
jgi:iron only hydrogenase large subunit-like protein